MGQRVYINTCEDFVRLAGQWWATCIMQTRISKAGEGESSIDTVVMADPDGESPEIVIDLTRLEGFGDVVIPPDDTFGIIFRKSDGGIVQSLAQTATRPTDGLKGDRGLYCSQAGTKVWLRGAESPNGGQIEILQASGSSIVLSPDGTITLTDKDGGTATLAGDTLTVGDIVKAAKLVISPHFSGDGAAPSALAGLALGSGGTATVSGDSTDAAMQIDFQAGSMGTAPGELCTVTFVTAYDRAPKVAYAPVDDIAAGPTLGGKFYFTTTTTELKAFTTGTPSPGDFFSLSIVVVQ